MSFLVLVVGGFIVPAVIGSKDYPIWIVAVYAAVFYLVSRSSAFRRLARLPSAPDTSDIPIGAFIGGWAMTFVVMLIPFGIGWLLGRIL